MEYEQVSAPDDILLSWNIPHCSKIILGYFIILKFMLAY